MCAHRELPPVGGAPEPRAPPARVVPNLPEALGSVGRCPLPRTRRGRATPLSVRKPRASAGLRRAGAAAPRCAGSRGGRHGNGRAGGRRHGDGAARGSVTPRARDSCAARRVVAARRRQATGVLQRPCSPRDVGRAGDPSTTEAASSCAGGGRSSPCCARSPGNPGPARSEVRPLQAPPQLCSPPACASKVRNVSPKPLRSYPRRGGKRPARGPRARAHPWAAGPAPCGTCVRAACPLPAPPPAATSPESLGGLLKLASPPCFACAMHFLNNGMTFKTVGPIVSPPSLRHAEGSPVLPGQSCPCCTARPAQTSSLIFPAGCSPLSSPLP